LISLLRDFLFFILKELWAKVYFFYYFSMVPWKHESLWLTVLKHSQDPTLPRALAKNPASPFS
jgi:hypothetical protein